MPYLHGQGLEFHAMLEPFEPSPPDILCDCCGDSLEPLNLSELHHDRGFNFCDECWENDHDEYFELRRGSLH